MKQAGRQRCCEPGWCPCGFTLGQERRCVGKNVNRRPAARGNWQSRRELNLRHHACRPSVRGAPFNSNFFRWCAADLARRAVCVSRVTLASDVLVVSDHHRVDSRRSMTAIGASRQMGDATAVGRLASATREGKPVVDGFASSAARRADARTVSAPRNDCRYEGRDETEGFASSNRFAS